MEFSLQLYPNAERKVGKKGHFSLRKPKLCERKVYKNDRVLD